MASHLSAKKIDERVADNREDEKRKGDDDEKSA
jgi:hypothetical protein